MGTLFRTMCVGIKCNGEYHKNEPRETSDKQKRRRHVTTEAESGGM